MMLSPIPAPIRRTSAGTATVCVSVYRPAATSTVSPAAARANPSEIVFTAVSAVLPSPDAGMAASTYHVAPAAGCGAGLSVTDCACTPLQSSRARKVARMDVPVRRAFVAGAG